MLYFRNELDKDIYSTYQLNKAIENKKLFKIISWQSFAEAFASENPFSRYLLLNSSKFIKRPHALKYHIMMIHFYNTKYILESYIYQVYQFSFYN